MSNLMLHCGSEAIDRNGLALVEPGDAMGARHNPVPYIDYVEQVTESLNHAGYRVNDELFGVQRDGGQFFGLMEISPAIEGEYLPAGEYGLTVGLRGAYDQTLARGLAIGSRVFVCDNLAFSGEVTFKTRQTTNISARLPGMIAGAVDQLIDLSALQDRRFDAYKNVEFKPRWGDAAITECVRRGIVNPSQVGKVIAEWDTPSHEEHAAQGFTLWRYHNAVTEAIKPVNGRAAVIPTQERTIKLTSFLDEVAGL
jgi:hypothetical protein